MPTSIITPNMSLVVPVVGQEPGPQYATDVNSSLNIIDGHNHTPGLGVPVPSDGISFNADLPAMGNRLTGLKSVTFSSQASPLAGILPDIDAIYVSGVDLYYNDGNGNQVRITQSGGVAGSPGSISGLTPPASASYNSGTSSFVWQSGVNTAAGMDNGPVTIREIAANARGITIQSPTGLGADYSITLLGTLPSITSMLQITASGQLVTPASIVQSQTVRRSTSVTASAGQIMMSSSSGSFTSNSVSPVNVTGMSGTLVTTGNPVMLSIEPAVGATADMMAENVSSGGIPQAPINFILLNGATVVASWSFGATDTPIGNFFATPPSFTVKDYPSIGTQSYDLQVFITSPGGYRAHVTNCVLTAYEL